MVNQRISFIAAVSENWVIGAGNKLIWDLPKDWENFKIVTAGKPFIMGRLSYESEDMLYSDKINYVLSRNKIDNLPEGFLHSYSLKEALTFLKSEPELFIVGGGRVFADAMHLANYLYLTIVHDTFDGDAFFPELDWSEWELVKSVKVDKDERHTHPFSLNEYKRK